ncbi:MAG TPA: hypothetical protein DD426_06355, partial [Clostridiaceae bacterium]|nr:hypothetical protein [Clostridiaceae bacterium]
MISKISNDFPVFDFKKDARYLGFFDFSCPEGPIFSWSGCSIQTNFNGTGIYAKIIDKNMTGNSWISVIIDYKESDPINIKPDKDMYVIAKGLKNEAHNLEIHKRTEALLGQLQFCGFELSSGGRFLTPPSEKARKIEIIGDSITCGAGNEGVYSGDDAEFLGKEENNYMSYGPIAARILDADIAMVSISGSGCYQNYGGAKENTIGDLYLKTNLSASYDEWNLKKWTPDVVVVNLGTNDFSAEIDTDKFKEKYKRL